MPDPQDVITPLSAHCRAWLEARGIYADDLSEYGVQTAVVAEHGYPQPGPGAGIAQNVEYAALAALHGRSNPFGDITPPTQSGDPDAAPCPVCGIETTPNFVPGASRVHSQVRGPLGTLLPSACREVVR